MSSHKAHSGEEDREYSNRIYNYAMTAKSVATGPYRAVDMLPGPQSQCMLLSQADIRTRKRRSSIIIFSAHITRNAMEIDVSEQRPLAW
jgi:hypothetical protein